MVVLPILQRPLINILQVTVLGVHPKCGILSISLDASPALFSKQRPFTKVVKITLSSPATFVHSSKDSETEIDAIHAGAADDEGAADETIRRDITRPVHVAVERQEFRIL